MSRKPRPTKLGKTLADLRAGAPGLKAAWVFTRDGFPAAGDHPGGGDLDVLSALAGNTTAALERLAGELALGEATTAVLSWDQGSLVLETLGPQAWVAVETDGDGKLGLALWAARHAKDAMAGLV